MHQPHPDEVTTREALAILGFGHPSTIARYVTEGKLLPIRKFPGRTGGYLFSRSAVEALRDAQEAEAS
jgi:hypothetical protein